ncbi:sodium:solute symporter family protein [Terracidiphilus gabretensis]|uniref:sodium:solute symporter family protein n=1 Tax=Terracidiphilus gabretensis TaxID=1577687 RepID=UPI00071B2167|nr:sodium:solute symporter family protein [Terracidiphilus gabretensis]
MSVLYVVVLAIISVSLMAVALYRTSRVKTKADYLVAGRSLPAIVLVLTLLTSWIGAGSLFAGAENAYKNGFAALWQPAGGWLGLLLIYFIAPRARKFAQFTLPDLLEARYNQTARVLGTFAILFAYVGITSYQFKGGGDVLHLIFPETISAQLGTYLIAAFVIISTALAGMSSVAYMDVAIGSLVTVICVIAAPYLLMQAGGWAALHTSLPPAYFTWLGNFRIDSHGVEQPVVFGVIKGLEFLVPTLLLMLGNQVMYQKFFSAKSERDAKISVAGWIVGTLVLETLIVAIAVFGRALYPTGEVALHPREIIPYTARHGLPAVLGALLLGAVFAKVISTASNYLFSPATNLINDVFVRYISPGATDKRVLIISRLAVVLLGCWALYQAVYAESILQKMLWAYTIYSAALTPVVLAAFYSKRVTAWGAVAAIAGGTLVTLTWDLRAVHDNLPAVIAQRDAIFPALIVAVVLMIVVSLFTPKPTEKQLAQLAD